MKLLVPLMVICTIFTFAKPYVTIVILTYAVSLIILSFLKKTYDQLFLNYFGIKGILYILRRNKYK